jgi:hypothetical protein
VCNDGLDNDCDGMVDEPDCVASCEPETRSEGGPDECSDKVDNDCDCVVDDCSIEDCTDPADNDGDGRKDADDPVCAP